MARLDFRAACLRLPLLQDRVIAPRKLASIRATFEMRVTTTSASSRPLTKSFASPKRRGCAASSRVKARPDNWGKSKTIVEHVGPRAGVASGTRPCPYGVVHESRRATMPGERRRRRERWRMKGHGQFRGSCARTLPAAVRSRSPRLGVAFDQPDATSKRSPRLAVLRLTAVVESLGWRRLIAPNNMSRPTSRR